MKNGLESCPFCGKETVKVVDRLDFVEGVVTKYMVKCSECGAQTKECATNYEAIELWNMRAGK